MLGTMEYDSSLNSDCYAGERPHIKARCHAGATRYDRRSRHGNGGCMSVLLRFPRGSSSSAGTVSLSLEAALPLPLSCFLGGAFSAGDGFFLGALRPFMGGAAFALSLGSLLARGPFIALAFFMELTVVGVAPPAASLVVAGDFAPFTDVGDPLSVPLPLGDVAFPPHSPSPTDFTWKTSKTSV